MRRLLLLVSLALLISATATNPERSLEKLSNLTNSLATAVARLPQAVMRLPETIADTGQAPPPGALADVPEVEVIPSIPEEVSEPLPAVLPGLAPIVKPIIPRTRAEICDTLTGVAQSNDLPAPFFIRLLYQESEFRPGSVSSAGAEGVAQFMPETSARHGLDNPYDPLQAIEASARFLRELTQRFGNLGLAAAAYNAGPKRITDWLAKKNTLPQETQDYVKNITGRPAELWLAAEHGSPAIKLPRDAPCQEAAGLLAWNGPDQIPLPPTRERAKVPPKSGGATKFARRDKMKVGARATDADAKTTSTREIGAGGAPRKDVSKQATKQAVVPLASVETTAKSSIKEAK
jgi:hypothetical protein